MRARPEEWLYNITVYRDEWRDRREDRRWERSFEQRSWMIQEGDTFEFNPERDFRDFDRWILERKRTHGRDYFRTLRDDLKARGAWNPKWSERSM